MLTALLLANALAVQAPLSAVVPHSVTETQVEQLFDSTGDMVAKDAAARAGDRRVITVADDERNFIDTYYPLVLTDDLDPTLEENMVLVWIVTAFLYPFVGPLWIPTVVGGIEVGDEYTSEALIGWLIHIIPYAVYLFTWVGGIGGFLGFAYSLANGLYFGPVHILNLASYHSTGAKKGGKKKKRRKKRSAHLDLPGMSAAAGAY